MRRGMLQVICEENAERRLLDYSRQIVFVFDLKVERCDVFVTRRAALSLPSNDTRLIYK
jgi:hypothetical protein